MNYYVYIHTSPSSKVYIGITKMQPEKRWGYNGSGYKRQQIFWRAIQKYGWDNFKHEILFEGLSKEDAEALEIKLIAQYKSNQREYGYNVENGGNAPGTHAEETKKKISNALKGEKNPMYGKSLSQESIRKREETKKIKYKDVPHYMKGRCLSEETKRKISESRTGKFVGSDSPMYGKCHTEDVKQIISDKAKERFIDSENHPMWGKHHSEEAKQRIGDKARERFANIENHPFYGKHHSEAAKKKRSDSRIKSGIAKGENNPNSKKVCQCDKDYHVINIWSYVGQAATQLNISQSTISQCCMGGCKTAGGCNWKYLYDQTRRDGTIIPGAITLGLITEEEVFKQLEEQKNTEGEN